MLPLLAGNGAPTLLGLAPVLWNRPAHSPEVSTCPGSAPVCSLPAQGPGGPSPAHLPGLLSLASWLASGARGEGQELMLPKVGGSSDCSSASSEENRFLWDSQPPEGRPGASRAEGDGQHPGSGPSSAPGKIMAAFLTKCAGRGMRSRKHPAERAAPTERHLCLPTPTSVSLPGGQDPGPDHRLPEDSWSVFGGGQEWGCHWLPSWRGGRLPPAHCLHKMKQRSDSLSWEWQARGPLMVLGPVLSASVSPPHRWGQHLWICCLPVRCALRSETRQFPQSLHTAAVPVGDAAPSC